MSSKRHSKNRHPQYKQKEDIDSLRDAFCYEEKRENVEEPEHKTWEQLYEDYSKVEGLKSSEITSVVMNDLIMRYFKSHENDGIDYAHIREVAEEQPIAELLTYRYFNHLSPESDEDNYSIVYEITKRALSEFDINYDYTQRYKYRQRRMKPDGTAKKELYGKVFCHKTVSLIGAAQLVGMGESELREGTTRKAFIAIKEYGEYLRQNFNQNDEGILYIQGDAE